jgi:hypothetical protein
VTEDHERPQPLIRVAPLGELKAYTVYEHQLDELAQGSTGSLYLNFSLALLSIFATVLITLVTVSIPPGYQFQGFFCACLITGISGLVLLLAMVQDAQKFCGSRR